MRLALLVVPVVMAVGCGTTMTAGDGKQQLAANDVGDEVRVDPNARTCVVTGTIGPVAPGTYPFGQSARSVDGCNTCSCDAQGFGCTTMGCPADAGANSCAALQAQASAPIAKVIDDHASCSADGDCISVPVATSCFDSCERAMNKSGNAALASAKAAAESPFCDSFHARGCTSFAPPCAPPTLPQCVSGTCQ